MSRIVWLSVVLLACSGSTLAPPDDDISRTDTGSGGDADADADSDADSDADADTDTNDTGDIGPAPFYTLVYFMYPNEAVDLDTNNLVSSADLTADLYWSVGGTPERAVRPLNGTTVALMGFVEPTYTDCQQAVGSPDIIDASGPDGTQLPDTTWLCVVTAGGHVAVLSADVFPSSDMVLFEGEVW